MKVLCACVFIQQISAIKGKLSEVHLKKNWRCIGICIHPIRKKIGDFSFPDSFDGFFLAKLPPISKEFKRSSCSRVRRRQKLPSLLFWPFSTSPWSRCSSCAALAKLSFTLYSIPMCSSSLWPCKFSPTCKKVFFFSPLSAQIFYREPKRKLFATLGEPTRHHAYQCPYPLLYQHLLHYVHVREGVGMCSGWSCTEA